MVVGPLLIRADASLAIGAGHVMRCLALAQVWRTGGGEVVFLMASTTDFITQRLDREGFKILKVTASPGTRDDADQTRNIALECHARWIVIDGYHFNTNYFASVRSARWQILRVEDEPGTEFELADAILNQNVDAEHSIYPEYAKSELLLGPRFALLRTEFAGAWQSDRQTPAMASKVLLTTGGGDPKNLLPRLVDAIKLCSAKLEIKIVVGTAPDKDLLPRSSYESDNSIELVIASHDMVCFEAWADIAVAAAGSTCWEFCALGLPSILIDVAENQRAVAERLNEKGIAVHIPAQEASPTRIAEEIDRLIGSPLLRQEMSRNGKYLVDGRGAYRVVGAMRALGMRFRRATQDDCNLLWKWANDPVTRANSFRPANISWDEHRDWLDRHLAKDRSIIFIAEESQIPVAVLRVEEKDPGVGEISITVSPEARGFGLAHHLIRGCMGRAARELNLREIHAFVKPENTASRRAFETAGYILSETTQIGGFDALRYTRLLVLKDLPVELAPILVSEH
ncbi:MAG TPA: UDP-2,4-diacetamido-2,4,6-trideoxy-beta-L-altropyranose hydrolase [Terriglobales bacterium]|nr:UDP-2,4-diacetamido-2,4,6-trideoxy-beta-L-altropyranose hydrolase [Terriglobales bacterium]